MHVSDALKSALIVLLLIVSVNVLLNNRKREWEEEEEERFGEEKKEVAIEVEKDADKNAAETPIKTDELYDFVYKSHASKPSDVQIRVLPNDPLPEKQPTVSEFEAFNISDGNFGTWA
jgi:hypothetical protein